MQHTQPITSLAKNQKDSYLTLTSLFDQIYMRDFVDLNGGKVSRNSNMTKYPAPRRPRHHA